MTEPKVKKSYKIEELIKRGWTETAVKCYLKGRRWAKKLKTGQKITGVYYLTRDILKIEKLTDQYQINLNGRCDD